MINVPVTFGDAGAVHGPGPLPIVKLTGAELGPAPALLSGVTVTLNVPAIPGGSGMVVDVVAVGIEARTGPPGV